MLDYVIVTPAFNEDRHIGRTIEAVLAQTRLPAAWFIVDDGSSDTTGAVARSYARRYPWIDVSLRERVPAESYYASNVYALRQGIERAAGVSYEFLAILDADIELESDYYERILSRFEKYPRLGIASGTYVEHDGEKLIEAKIDRRHTPKAIQVFRRACYEEIGGYIPFKNGGEDSGTELMARMHGWQTWSFSDLRALHLRPVGMGSTRSVLRSRFRFGLTDHGLGTHPLFMVAKCARRAFWERPFIISAALRLIGYLSGFLTRQPIQMPPEAVRYLRKEQLGRLLSLNSFREEDWVPDEGR